MPHGWILTALARFKVPATPEERGFLLSQQSPEGWWSLIPVGDRAELASTYGTAWALQALQGQLQQHLVSGTDAAAVSSAVQRAVAWLLMNRSQRARWKDYPLAPDGKVFVSMSGLALHALHVAAAVSMRDVDREWLDNLPGGVLSPDTMEPRYHWLKLRPG